MIIDRKYLLFSIKPLSSKRIYRKDLLTIYFRLNMPKLPCAEMIGYEIWVIMRYEYTYTPTAAKVY